MTAQGHPVVLVPGGVLPGALAYGDLVSALGERVDAVVKELEVYAGEEPPPAYSLDTEVQAIARAADARGFDRFHLLGYSAGGACALAFLVAHGERLLSVALMEPAWAGHERTAPEEALAGRLTKLRGLPPDEFMPAFVALQVAPGVQPPPRPDGPPPPWMARRPGGLRALIDAFDAADLDVAQLRRFDRPVYFALGGRSNPEYYARMAARLRELFPDFTLETFAERHHFDPPHRAEPERVATSLLDLWRRAEERA